MAIPIQGSRPGTPCPRCLGCFRPGCVARSAGAAERPQGFTQRPPRTRREPPRTGAPPLRPARGFIAAGASCGVPATSSSPAASGVAPRAPWRPPANRYMGSFPPRPSRASLPVVGRVSEAQPAAPHSPAAARPPARRARPRPPTNRNRKCTPRPAITRTARAAGARLPTLSSRGPQGHGDPHPGSRGQGARRRCTERGSGWEGQPGMHTDAHGWPAPWPSRRGLCPPAPPLPSWPAGPVTATRPLPAPTLPTAPTRREGRPGVAPAPRGGGSATGA